MSFFITGAFGAYIVSQKINPDKFVVPTPISNSLTNSASNSTNLPAPTKTLPTANVADNQAVPTPTPSPKNTGSGNGMMNGNGGGANTNMGMMNQGKFKDGEYVGPASDAYYGYVQVKAVISGGKLADVVFLQYPNDRSTSRYINEQATPYLRSEAISAQSANVNIISGATDTSLAFRQSLASALAQATR